MNSNSEYAMRTLGSTGIQISPIGLGVMQFSGGGRMSGMIFPAIPQSEKDAILQAALDGGINWFDTAEMYGMGVSEQSLAVGLNAAGITDQDVVIATKWMPFLRTARNIPRTIDKRLGFLNGYSIDLYMIHQPVSFSSPEAEMNAMADLVEAGKIRSVGVSNFDADRMRRAHRALAKRGIPLAANQVHYSLLHRSIEANGILDTARELGVTIIAYSPLEFGLLSGKYHQNPETLSKKSWQYQRRLKSQIERTRPLIQALEEIADRYHVAPAQVALNWLIQFQGETVVAIPGASKVQQAQENAGAMHFQLSEQDLARLDEQSKAVL